MTLTMNTAEMYRRAVIAETLDRIDLDVKRDKARRINGELDAFFGATTTKHTACLPTTLQSCPTSPMTHTAHQFYLHRKEITSSESLPSYHASESSEASRCNSAPPYLTVDAVHVSPRRKRSARQWLKKICTL